MKDKVRIISKGMNYGTRVVLPSGEHVPNVRRVYFTHRPGHVPVAVVEIIDVEVELEARLKEDGFRFVNPNQRENKCRKNQKKKRKH